MSGPKPEIYRIPSMLALESGGLEFWIIKYDAALRVCFVCKTELHLMLGFT